MNVLAPLTSSNQLTDIGSIHDVPARGARRFIYKDTKIAIFRDQNNHFYALEDSCPHKQGPLSQGIVHDECVTCPLHNWVISLKTGEVKGPDEGQTRIFDLSVENERLLIDLSAL